MRKNSITILTGVLAAQAVLAALLYIGDGGEAAAPEPLLSLEVDKVDAIELASAETKVRLTRAGAGWQLDGGLPADNARVESLLEGVAAVKTSWPVADSAGALERLEVAQDKFQTQISLHSDGAQPTVIYLGTAPSFRQTHVRRAGEDEVYAVNFDRYSAASSRDQWLDTALLRPAGDITRISAGDFSIERPASGEWPAPVTAAAAEADAGAAPNDGADSESAATDAAPAAAPVATAEVTGDTPATVEFDPAEFSEVLASLTVLGEAGASANLDQAGKGIEHFTFTVQADIEHRFELIKTADEYYLKRDDYATAFRLSQHQYDRLVALKQYLDTAQG